MLTQKFVPQEASFVQDGVMSSQGISKHSEAVGRKTEQVMELKGLS